MRIVKFFYVAFTLVVCFTFSTNLIAGNQVNWDAFSENLIIAVQSGHPGLQQSAMQRIIQYADSLDVDETVYPLIQIFRFNDSPQVRRLAMVTLSKINTDHAISYLYKYMKFEDNVTIRHQCCCIINDYCKARSPEKEKEIAALSLRLE